MRERQGDRITRQLEQAVLDGRFTGWNPDYGSETPERDPSMNAITGPYSAALNHYVRIELGYENDLPYEIINMDAAKNWSGVRSAAASRSSGTYSLWRAA